MAKPPTTFKNGDPIPTTLRGTPCRHCIKRGQPCGTHGGTGTTPGRKEWLTETRAKAIIELVEQGSTETAAAATVGCHPGTLSRYLREGLDVPDNATGIHAVKKLLSDGIERARMARRSTYETILHRFATGDIERLDGEGHPVQLSPETQLKAVTWRLTHAPESKADWAQPKTMEVARGDTNILVLVQQQMKGVMEAVEEAFAHDPKGWRRFKELVQDRLEGPAVIDA